MGRRRIPHWPPSLAQEGILGRVRGVPRLSAGRRSSLHRLEDRRAREQVGRQAIRGGDELRATRSSSTSAARWPGRATRRELRSSRTRSNSSPRSRYCSSGSATPSASFVTTIVCERSFRRRRGRRSGADPARARGRGRRSRVHRADGPVARRAAGSPPRHGRPSSSTSSWRRRKWPTPCECYARSGTTLPSYT